MEIKFFYIHGLNGSNQSKKFLELKEYYPNIVCLSWSKDDDINLKLEEWKQIIRENDAFYMCVIASSMGGNFAYQLRKKCVLSYFTLVLINPLFDVKDVQVEVPSQLNQFLAPIIDHRDSLILLGKKDTVIENQKYLSEDSYIKRNNQIVVDDESTHRFENLKDYFKLIDRSVDSIC
ncbi:MAG: YqiA/YcfP family alpha/beta fold hydrolase [Flavobacterium sp.]